MKDTLLAKQAEWQTALQRCAEQETTLLEQLAQVRAQGQRLQGALASVAEMLALPDPPRAERRRKK